MQKKNDKKGLIDDLPSDYLSSEEMFNHAFEFAPIGMTIVGPKGDFWKVNRAFCEFVGYSNVELCTMQVFDVTFRDDRQTTIDMRDELLSGGTSLNREEKRYVRKDGEIVWGLMTRSVAFSTVNEIQYTLGHIQDITELKKTQKTLVESEERYERAISGTADGIWEVNLQTGEDFKSPRWQAMLGYADDEIGGANQDFLKLLHPKDLELANRSLAKRMASNQPVDYTMRMRHKEGHYVHIQSRGQVFSDANGTPLYISGAHTDITDRILTEAELEKTRRQLVDAIEALTDAFAIFDAEDKLVICNEKYLEYYKKSGDLIVPGVDFEEIVRASVGRGLYIEAIGREEEWVQARLERHRNPQLPHEQELDDGRWLRVVESRTSDGGSVGFRVDITDLKMREKALGESEDRYRSLIETSPDGIIVLSEEKKILFANQQAAKLYAVDKSEDLIGLEFTNFIHPDSYDIAKTHRDERLTEGRHSAYHLMHQTTDGNVFDAEISAVTIPWDGQEAGLLIIRDISDLQKVNRLKDEFISTISHELRTPLTSIKGSLGLLKSETLGILPEEVKSMLEIAYSNSDRLALLINDILDIQKFESGKNKFKRDKIDIAKLVKKSIEANKGYSDGFNVSFVLKKAPAGIFVSGDEDRLMQVLSNLLSNAAKFSPEKGIVELSVSKKKGTARIAVADQGCGIAQENHTHIFKKFTQVDSTDTRQKGGTGLGLNISRTIVEQHEGKMSFDSELGKGATFYFTLPLAES